MAEQSISKRCSKCKHFKQLSEFYKNPITKDGYRHDCKVCCLKRVKIYSQTKKGKAVTRKAGQRQRQSDNYKVYQKVYQKYYRQTEAGKTAFQKGNKRYYQSEKAKRQYRINAHLNHIKNPIRRKIGTAVKQAIISGKLQPLPYLKCYYCGTQAKDYHHWHGYEPEHWLDVISVCRKCHYAIHRKSG